YKDANAILNASKNLNLNNTTPIFGYTGATGSTPSVMVGNIGTTGNTTLALSQINDYTKFSNSYNNALTFNNQLKDTGITATFKIDGNGVQATVSNGQTKVNVNMSDFQTFTKNDTGYCVVTDNSATQFNTDGTTTTVKLDASTTTDDFDIDTFAKYVKEQGFDRGLDYAKCYGAVNEIKAYDANNKEIYTATNVGYLKGDHSIALEYTFAQDYEGDNIYFRNVKTGDHKVTVENFYHDQDATKQSGMVYTAGTKKQGDAPYVANNGLEINANIEGVEKVTSWSTNSDGNQVAKTIDFVNGKMDIDGDGKEENCASAFEVATINKDGSVSIKREELTDAYTYPPVTNNNDNGNGSDSGNEESLIEQYRQVLTDANSVQVSAHDDDKNFYSGYKYIKEDGYIDTSKIVTVNYNSQDPNHVTSTKTVGDTTVVSYAEIQGTDWCYDRKVVANSKDNRFTETTKNDDGTITVNTYSYNVVFDNNFNYTKDSKENSNCTTYNYDKNGNFVSGHVKAKAGTEISPTFDGILSGDTIKLNKDVDFDFKVENGKVTGVPTTALEALQSGTYQNKTGTGTLEDISIELTSDGQIGITGVVRINDNNTFEITKGAASENNNTDEGGENQSTTDAKGTKAVIEENENEYKVSNGTVSLRAGQLVVVGDGATALSGSKLLSSNGQVQISGDYTFNSNGEWVGSEGSTYKYVNPTQAKESMSKSLGEVGLSFDGEVDFSASQTGNISLNPETMFNNLVSSSPDGINLIVSGKTYTTAEGIVFNKGAKINFSFVNDEDFGYNTDRKTLAIKVNKDTSVTYNLPEGLTAYNKQDKEVSKDKLTQDFKQGEYVKLPYLLKKAGVSYLSGTANWNGEDVNVKISLYGSAYAKYTEANSDTGLMLVSDHELKKDEYIKDEFGNLQSPTSLVGEYNGTNFTVLSGARIKLAADGKIVITDAKVYTENMHIEGLNDTGNKNETGENNQNGSPQTSSEESSDKTDTKAQFEGTVDKNSNCTGIFNHYSDDTIKTVFSAATVANEGSILTKGSWLYGSEVKYESEVHYNEDGNLEFKYTMNGRQDYIETNTEEISAKNAQLQEVFGDNVKVSQTGYILVDGETYDYFDKDSMTKLAEVASQWQYAKAAGSQAEAAYGKGNVSVTGTKVTVDGKTYDVSIDSEASALSTAIYNKQAEKYIEEHYDDMDDYRIVYNDDGTIKGIEDTSGKTSYYAEVKVENNVLTITDDRITGFANWSREVKVTEVYFNADGSYTENKMEAKKIWWNADNGTSATVTNYNAKGEQVGDSVTYDESVDGYSHCDALAKYGRGELDGEKQICKDVKLFSNSYSANENDMYGLNPNGSYRYQGVALGSGDNVHVNERIVDTETSKTVVSASYDVKSVGNSKAKGMDLKTSKTGNFAVNAKVSNRVVTINDANGFRKTTYDYSGAEGEAYINNAGQIIAESFEEGTIIDNVTGQTVKITADKPSVHIANDYNQQRMNDLSENAGYGNCVALSNNGIDMTFGDYNINNCYIFFDQSDGKTTATIVYWDEQQGELVTKAGSADNTESDAAVEIYESTDSKAGTEGAMLTIQKKGNTLSVSKADYVVTGTHTEHVPSESDPSKPTAKIVTDYKKVKAETHTVSYEDNGDVNTSSLKVLRDDKGNLTGRLQRTDKTQSLDGSTTTKFITATFNEEYDEDVFTISSPKYTDVSGYEVSTTSKGTYVSITIINGGSISYSYDDDDRVTETKYGDYSETVYKIDGDVEIDFASLNESIIQNGMNKETVGILSKVKGLSKGNTTVKTGTVYTAYDSDKLKSALAKTNSIPADKKGSITFPSDAESVTINDIKQQTFDENMNQIDEEKINTVEATYPKYYSMDGTNYYTSEDFKEKFGDDEVAKYSWEQTDTLYSRVESTYENNKKLADGEVIITETEPYRTTTVNYFGQSSQTMIVGGKAVYINSIKSETTKTGLDGKGFTQTVTRGKYQERPTLLSTTELTNPLGYNQNISNPMVFVPIIVTKTVGYTERTAIYSDGSEHKTIRETYEQKQELDENKKPIITTEYDVYEIKNTDAKGNVYIDRTAKTATVNEVSEDGKSGKMTRYCEDIYVHTAIEDKQKTEETTVGTTRTYKEDKDGTYEMTVSENSRSVKRYDEENIVQYEYTDSGNYYTAVGVTNLGTVDSTGKLTNIGDTSNATIIRRGRDIAEKTYNYNDGSTKADSVVNSTTSYDYIANIVTVSNWTRENKYDNDGELTEYVDPEIHTKVFGLYGDFSINYEDLQREEFGYNRVYNIKTTDTGKQKTTTNDFKQDNVVFDYKNEQYYISTNSGHNEITVDTKGDILNKKSSGGTKYWNFSDADSLENTGIRNIGIQSIDIENNGGAFDAAKSYEYTTSDYTYDNLGRETGYKFERTYYVDPFTGLANTQYSGTSETSYNYTELNGVKIDGMQVVSTTKTTVCASNEGKELSSISQYYSNSEVGNTSVYTSIGTSGVTFANISSIANDVLQNKQIKETFVKMTTAKQDAQNKADIKVLAIVGAVVATIVATIISIASFGTGSGSLVGVAALWGAILGNATAAAVATAITVVALTAYAAYEAAQFAAAAVDCAFEGNWAGFGMNLLLCGISIFSAGSMINGLGSMGAALAGSTVKELSKVGLKEAAKAGVKARSGDVVKTFGKEILKTALKRAVVGSAVGGCATAAFIGADHYFNGTAWSWDDAGKILLGSLSGAAAGALTTNVGNIFGKLSKAGIIQGLVESELKQIQFANTMFNLGKNMFVAGNILKSTGDYIISDSGFDTKQQKSLINIFDSAVDIYMFIASSGMKAPGGEEGKKWVDIFKDAFKNTFTKGTFIGGGIGAVTIATGSIILQATNGLTESWNWNNVDWLTVGKLAFAGFVLGGGVGNVTSVGWKEAYKGAWTAFKSGLAPTQLFTNSVNMIGRIMKMQLVITGIGGILDNVTGGISTKIIEYLGVGLLDEGLTMLGVGMNLVGNMRAFSESLSGDWLGGISKFMLQTKATMTEPSMWLFSVGTAAAQPLFGPILLRTPILGTSMQIMNDVGNKFSSRISNVSSNLDEMLNMIYEEGFKEGISGLFGQILFGNSQFGEIFQELFDDTPDFNFSMADYNNGTYESLGDNAAQNLAAINSKADRAKVIARMQNTINSRANNLDGGTRQTNLTAEDILSADSGVYGLLLNSDNVSNIRNELIVRIAAANNRLDARETSRIRQLVNSNNANVSRSSYLNAMRNSEGSAGLMATYLQDASGVVLANKGRTDSITDTTDTVQPTQLTSYVDGLSQIYQQQTTQNMPVSADLTKNMNSAFGRLQGSFEIINAIGTALRYGVEYNNVDSSVPSVKTYIDGIQNTDSIDFNANTFNNNLAAIFKALRANETDEVVSNFVLKISNSQIINNVISKIKDADFVKYTYRQAQQIINSDTANIEELYFASQVMSAHKKTKTNETILSKLNSLDLTNMSTEEQAIAATIVNNIKEIQTIDMSKYGNINNLLDTTNVDTTVTSEQKVAAEEVINNLNTGKYDVDSAVLTDIKTAAQDYVKEYQAAKNANVEYINSNNVSRVESTYFLTDAQMAKIANMSESELKNYLKYNLAAQAMATILNDNMRQSVRQYMIESVADSAEAEQDYNNLIDIIEGKVVIDATGNEVTLDDLKAKYKFSARVPFAIEALKGFRAGQQEAFRDILQATVENDDSVKEKSKGYAQELQTAGGKSIIGLFSVLLLTANPNVQNKESKFITWLTNENSNAEDLYNHVNFVFGSSLGNIELITNTENKEGLREKLDNAGIVIGTYSGWGSLFSETMAGLLSYGSDETDQTKIDQVNHNKQILKGAGIELDEITLSDGKTVKVQFKNAQDSAKAIQILLAEGQGLDRCNLPIDRISQLVGDELDYAATIPASALASAAGKYTAQYGMVDYYQKLLNGETVEVSDYAYLGVTEETLNLDKELLATREGKLQLGIRRNAYKTISDVIAGTYRNVTNKMDVSAIQTTVAANTQVQEAMNLLGLSEQQIKDIVTEQYSSIRNLEVRTRLLGIANNKDNKLTVTIDGQEIDIAQMSRFSEGDKGTRNIDTTKGEYAVIRTEAAEEVQKGYRDNHINNVREAVVDSMNGHNDEVADAQINENAESAEQPIMINEEQYNKALEQLIDTIYSEYGDIFSSKTAVREFL
ncbi:MAG: hypothetical protein II816_04600, partial [Elusimicrobia bacterium]|nr:hypothetical protein [Elusimicrobiota bacterium]